ncbi:MAG: DUF4129 domain-containing protein [Caldilineaceae bacterium]
MAYILPILLNLMRFAWLWPWMILLQSFLSPSYPHEIVNPWLLVTIPLLSFLTATWVTMRGGASMLASQTAASETRPAYQRRSSRVGDADGIGWGNRFLVAVTGLLVVAGVAWWQHYQATFAFWDLRWLYELGYTLTHWGTQEVPPAVLTVLFGIYLWINGMGDAVRAMTHDDVWGTLVRSVTAMVLFVILVTIAGRPLPENLFYLIVLLFGAGMLALALSSLKITVGLDLALGLGQRRMTATPTISRYWLSSVLITVGGLLGLGLLIGIFLAPEQLAFLISAGRTVIGWIGAILGQILLAVSYLLFLVIYFFMRLLEPLIQRLMERMADTPLMEMLNNVQDVEQMEQVAEGAAPLPDSYRWMALAVVMAVVLIAFALAVRRLRTTPAAVEDETRESILTTDLLQEQLSDLWNRWFGRRRSPQDPFLSLAGESETRRRIRAVYQQLLTAAATVGAARTPAETPDEYAHHLPQQWASGQDQDARAGEANALATITAAYHQARYAPDAPDVAQSEAAQMAWNRLAARFQTQTETEKSTADSQSAGG